MVVIFGALAAVGPASASTLAIDAGGTLRFDAEHGEINQVDATDLGTGGAMKVTDPGSTITVGNGCVQVNAHEPRCFEPPLDAQDFAVDLADGDDYVRAFKLGPGRIIVDGGRGVDTIDDVPQSGPDSGAEVSGGPGNDIITAFPNFGGTVDVHGDGGVDTIDCGRGLDRYVVYVGDTVDNCEIARPG